MSKPKSEQMNFQDLINTAAAGTDFTKESTGGNFKRELPEAGMGVCRFREYIELGKQDTATKTYPNKKPAYKARFVFELTTPKHVKEVEKEDKTTIKIPHVIGIECAISSSDRSNYIKLFRQLNWDGTATHPAQCLGKPYLCEIVHAWAKGDDPAKDEPKYANLQKDGVYTLSAPRKVDPLAGTVEELAVPEALNDLKIFLWDHPTQATWDSLFIDGTWERDGKEVSKNWLQEKILGAHDYAGSQLEAMLAGVDDLGKTGGEKETSPSNLTENTTEVADPLAGLGV